VHEVNVGEVIASVMPSARPNPCAKAVLPAPISPASTMMSPARASLAIAAAIAWVWTRASRRAATWRLRCYDPDPVRRSRHPRDPWPDPAHDLVPDRPEPFGPVLGSDPLAGLSPEEHHLVAHRDGGASPTSTISWSIVTTPTIGCRRPPTRTSAPAGPERAEPSRHAVGVADRHRRDRRVGRRTGTPWP
jgi:hypothetical protein